MDPLYSLAGAVCAIITVLVILCLTPVRLCSSAYSLQRSTTYALSPILMIHLRMLCVEVEQRQSYNTGYLVLIYLLAPLISFGVAITACVSAAFWIFTLIMGNPDGSERRDDGRDAILAVRNWWARYLTRALH